MTDACIVKRISALQSAQKALHCEHAIQLDNILNRHYMQIEDMEGQIRRFEEAWGDAIDMSKGHR